MLSTLSFTVLLALVCMTNGGISNPTLLSFCHSEILDQHGLIDNSDERVKNEYCEQRYDIFVDNDKDAKALCKKGAPFKLKSFKLESDNTVTCQWKTISTCPGKDDIQLFDTCLRMGSIQSANNVTCPQDYSHYTVRSQKDANWISLLMRLKDRNVPLTVANKVDSNHHLLIPGLVFDGEGFKYANLKEPLMLTIVENNLFEVPAAKLVSVEPSVELRPLCATPAKAMPLSGGLTKKDLKEEIPEHLLDTASVVGERIVLRTRNVYQPKMLTNTTIDVSNFHEVCQRISSDTFSAMPNLDAELQQYKTPSYISGRHAPNRTLIPQNPGCTKHSSRDFLMGQFQSISTTYNESGINTTSWEDTYPANQCSDGYSNAIITSGKNGKLRDSPPITRHPLICIKGTPPEETPFNMCRENSVIDGDGCKCKEGYVDIVDTDIEQKNQFPKGQVCARDKPCDPVNGEAAIVFAVDLSGYVCDEQHYRFTTFIRSAGKFLSNQIRIAHVPFAALAATYDWLEKGWSPKYFARTVPYMPNGCSTKTVTFLDQTRRNMGIGQAIDVGIKATVDKLNELPYSTTKFVILTMDRFAKDKAAAMQAAKNARKANIRLIIVMISYTIQDKSEFMNLVEDPSTDLIDLTGAVDEKLTEEAMKNLLRKVCKGKTFEDFVNAN